MAAGIIRGSALSALAMATSGLVRLVFSVVVGRTFGPQVLGSANVIISAAMFASLLVSPGFGQSLSKQLALRSSDGRDPVGRNLVAWATKAHHVLLLIVAGGATLTVPVGEDRGWLFLLVVAYGLYTYYKAVLYGVGRVTGYVGLELAADATFLIALVVVAVLRANPVVLLPVALVYVLVALGAEVMLGGLFARAPLPLVGLRPLVAFACVTALGTAASTGFLQLAQLVAGWTGGPHGAGLFAAALAIVTPAYLLPRALSMVLFPTMARARGRSDSELLGRHYAISTRLLAGAALPGFVVAALVAPWLVRVVYGQDFSAASAPLSVMVWATWLYVGSVPAVNAVSSDPRRARYLLPMCASLAGAGVGVLYWLLHTSTIRDVAIGYLLCALLQGGVPFVVAYKEFGTLTSRDLGRWFVALAVGVGGAAVVATESSFSSPFIAVAIVACVCLLVAPDVRSLARAALDRSPGAA